MLVQLLFNLHCELKVGILDTYFLDRVLMGINSPGDHVNCEVTVYQNYSTVITSSFTLLISRFSSS